MEKLCTDAAAALSRAANAVEASAWEAASTDYGVAASLLEKALLDALCKQASTLMQFERYGDAIEAAQRASLAAPEAAEPRYWQALAHERLGARAKARVAYKKAAELEKDLSKKAMYLDSAARCSAEVEAAAKECEKQLEEARKMAEQARQVREKVNTPLTPAAGVAPALAIAGAKMDWYQSAQWVNVDVMAKGVNKEKSVVEIGAKSLKMRLVREGKEDWVLERELYEEIDPTVSRWSASKYKVEVHLRKKVEGATWQALDKEAEVASASVRASAVAARRMKDVSEKQKGWAKTAEDELKDYKEDDSAMAVFRQIYEASDEDTRKAMIKSYSESGGQVLSTNWGEVKKERVKYTPVGERKD